jgi:hypothetical protein
MLGILLVSVSIMSTHFISAFQPVAATAVTQPEIIQEQFNEGRNCVEGRTGF